MILTLIVSALFYIALLFIIALWGEQRASRGYKLSLHPWVYALSLAIYCTSWTYYGAVGNAVNGGWSFLPILLGPALLYIFALPLMEKMVRVSKQQNITSLADFIASRYGKSHRMALVITLISAAAIIPYIALQLKAVGMSFNVLSNLNPGATGGTYKELVVALLMALFAIAFGTRRIDITQYRSGMMLSIAFESTVKLIALCAGAVFVWVVWRNAQAEGVALLPEVARSIGWAPLSALTPEFIIQLMMAAGAIICLPRQFHVSVVDNVNVNHLKTARWLFPVYLLLTAGAIAVTAWAGQGLFPTAVSGDVYALLLPIEQGITAFSILVYIGGISAATAMVIIATLTLSTMISNDVIMPVWLARSGQKIPQAHRFYRRLLTVRRTAIVLVLILGWLCYHLWMAELNLVSIGLLAFSVVLQVIPAVLGGLYWRKGHARGVYMGLAVGSLTWLVLLLLPLINSDTSQNESIITFGTLYSVLANAITYYLFSLLAEPSLLDKIQATAFVKPRSQVRRHTPQAGSHALVSDLMLLLETFLGGPRSQQLLEQYQKHSPLQPQDTVTPEFTDFTERAIAGVLGAASARSLVSAALVNRQLKLEEVVHFFDDTTQALQTQQSIMYSSLENLAQGISVVDKDLRLVVWNKRYLELFEYPDGMVQPGRPIADLIRYNAERGECGVGEVDELVSKRLRYMQEGSPHRFIRRRSDGRVIEMVGNPLPDGGFVTSFTDVTSHIETQQALEDANINLEARIETRTQEVREINRELTEEIERRRVIEKQLQAAKAEAENANASKTRFLALASHDIVQPLNAARLYLSAVDVQSLEPNTASLLNKVDNALNSTENLLSSLLAIAKMEQGAMQPQRKHIQLSDILDPLVEEYTVLARELQSEFHTRIRNAVIETDPMYLRRIVQNFLSNALKYSDRGKVLLAVRLRQHCVEIQVYDTGPGIPENQFGTIFEAFVRLHKGSVSGVGLGLSVAKRMAEQLDCPLTLRSNLGRGSCFTVKVPYGKAEHIQPQRTLRSQKPIHAGMSLLCVDDVNDNLDALEALLSRWGVQCVRFTSGAEALAWAAENPPVDGMLLDYQLGTQANGEPEPDGIQLAQQLRQLWQEEVPGALITAVRELELKEQARQQQLQFLAKPLKPAQLKSLLQVLQRAKAAR
ncbi:PAS domain-containing hybrid sensor histidine kinase/response regulator [Aliidiomarina celeris]|uniref:PAS domain-containing hybrid sensor histidine kinase/response regulator n=1 Tax=Aliidiomarina celeris TaxID=2249428 RepID=UPI000DE9269A|nr:PAS domain-containing hybrid sensor histidine kinase/response regulator [Aliidiomarina celeris]